MDEHNLKGMEDWSPTKETYYEWYERGRKPNNPEGRAHYLGQLYYLDLEIGKLLDFLEKDQQLKNTIIIYVGDNGGSTQIYADNGKYEGGKYTMYDGGLRIPLLVSWKDHYQMEVVTDNMVSAMDILPTLMDATATKIPETVDGLSLHDLLTGENPNIVHETLYWYGGEQAAVRSKQWKYRWANDAEDSFAKKSTTYEGVNLETGHFIHDTSKDIGERNNLKETKPQKLKELQEKLAVWKKEVIGDIPD